MEIITQKGALEFVLFSKQKFYYMLRTEDLSSVVEFTNRINLVEFKKFGLNDISHSHYLKLNDRTNSSVRISAIVCGMLVFSGVAVGGMQDINFVT
jgi:hypothetical protein